MEQLGKGTMTLTDQKNSTEYNHIEHSEHTQMAELFCIAAQWLGDHLLQRAKLRQSCYLNASIRSGS